LSIYLFYLFIAAKRLLYLFYRRGAPFIAAKQLYRRAATGAKVGKFLERTKNIIVFFLKLEKKQLLRKFVFSRTFVRQICGDYSRQDGRAGCTRGY
jgi:hypothetical protein